MVLGRRCLFLIGNGAEIRPLEKGRKSPVVFLKDFFEKLNFEKGKQMTTKA